MGGAPAARGARLTAIFYQAVWRLNVEQTFGVGLDLTRGRKVHPRENPDFAYEKRAPALRWYAPRMVNPALVHCVDWYDQDFLELLRMRINTFLIAVLKQELRICFFAFERRSRHRCKRRWEKNKKR